MGFELTTTAYNDMCYFSALALLSLCHEALNLMRESLLNLSISAVDIRHIDTHLTEDACSVIYSDGLVY